MMPQMGPASAKDTRGKSALAIRHQDSWHSGLLCRAAGPALAGPVTVSATSAAVATADWSPYSRPQAGAVS